VAQPRITRNMNSSITPMNVLDFWFGEGAWDTEKMNDMSPRMPLWFGMNGTTYHPISVEEKNANDATCLIYADLIRSSGRGELMDKKEWITPSGLYAQMLLTDQICRNAFRGTSEAFATDDHAMKLARIIFTKNYYKDYNTFTPFIFLVTPGQHSEDIADHELNSSLTEYFLNKFPDDVAPKTILKHCEDHTNVVKRFGRYPHRNILKNRESTPEEEAWLADTDNLPSWAKSQIPK
jgi:uncharacterized protein (DUF924 family)